MKCLDTLGANGWTGGQYSVFRIGFGIYLTVHFAALIPWSGELFSAEGMLPDPSASPLFGVLPNLFAWVTEPIGVRFVFAGATLLAFAFAIGLRDRLASVALWYVLACAFARNPLIANPSLPYVGWLLLAHAALPRAPHGSWDGRRRVSLGWAMPPAIFAAAWIVMVVGYTYSGYTKLASPSWLDGSAFRYVLENPLARPTWLRDALLVLPASVLGAATLGALALELCAAPLALLHRLRPWLWLALLGMHLGLLVLIDFADLTLGMIVLHGFTLDPAWIDRRRRAGAEDDPPARVYFDGACGLCHGFVRFLVAEDRTGQKLRFAPLGGATFTARVSEDIGSARPDSIVVETPDGAMLTRADAVLYAIERLGGLWRVLACIAALVPRASRDRIYTIVARRRGRSEVDVCPLLPAALRARFDT
jgi:predicted DCC family thiol-disulfide oxidoreductase YuxK